MICANAEATAEVSLAVVTVPGRSNTAVAAGHARRPRRREDRKCLVGKGIRKSRQQETPDWRNAGGSSRPQWPRLR